MVTVRRKSVLDGWKGDAAETYRQTRQAEDESRKPTHPTAEDHQKVNLLEAEPRKLSKNQAETKRRRSRSVSFPRSSRPMTSAVKKPRRSAIQSTPAIVETTQPLLHPLLPDLEPSDVKVSIVFGTYNRFRLLQNCVESIRKACRDITYEIVVSDGGSTDGSSDWLRQQHDVVFLEGDLSGAVVAFNDAARRARGEFVLALNDDAELDLDAVNNGLKHFKDPLVGQVAFSFYEHKTWKIETVHQRIYANFALTRANIVRAVEQLVGGMWATCYRTYGGDTEFSCWVHRFGYKVVGATDAKVVHQEYVDDLRRKNTKVDIQRNQFHTRWSCPEQLYFRGMSPGVDAPTLQKLAQIENGETVQTRRSRIVLADPELGQLPLRTSLKPERVLHWQLRTTDDPQTSMVQALRKLGSAGHENVDWTGIAAEDRGQIFVEKAKGLRPTVVFLQCQNPDAIPVDALKAVREDAKRDPSLVVCVWSGDIGPSKGPWSGSGDEWQYRISPAVDLMLFTGTGQVQHHRARGMTNAAYLQIGYDVDRYYVGPSEQYGSKHAITFMGQNYGPQFDGVPDSEAQLRRDAVAALRAVRGFVPYGAGFGKAMPQEHSGNIYRSSAMALSISLTSKLGRYSSDRLLRSMACGCPTLVKRFDDMEGMGLIDGVNCLGWDHPGELPDVARAWLAPDRRAELQALGQRGAALMDAHHTWDVRMEELMAIVNIVRKQQ